MWNIPKIFQFQKAAAILRENQQYLSENPQILSVVRDFYTAVITEKPEDIYQFAREHFSAFQEWKKNCFYFL